MKQVVVSTFGDASVLGLHEVETPEPGAGQVRVRVTSVGLNRADLMGRQGKYKASTGDPPFTPGLEAGGVIEAVGAGVDKTRLGQRVVLAPGIPRPVDGAQGGTYRSHLVVDDGLAIVAPSALPDEQLGAIVLTYLTAWGCLRVKHALKPGDVVGIPAASSGVGLAAAQVARDAGAVTIGLTSSPDKVEQLKALPNQAFDHLIVTHDQGELRSFRKDIKAITDGHGVDVFFDPVAAGAYLDMEIKSLAMHGTIYVYGLLGSPGVVDVSPLIIKHAKLDSYLLDELVTAGESVWRQAMADVLERFGDGRFTQHIAQAFALDDVQEAHRVMAKNEHLGKLVLLP